VPIGHLGLGVPDLAAAQAYYDRVLPALDYEPFFVHDDEVAYLPSEGRRGAYLFLYPSEQPQAPQHLAFIVRTRADVDAVHELVVELGGVIVHPPRDWPEYPPPYYAAFWRDPHGFLLEAVCHH
jgi:catechol 2,3-dioxygenase-like lactoylglutathione lyase family enzyme